MATRQPFKSLIDSQYQNTDSMYDTLKEARDNLKRILEDERFTTTVDNITSLIKNAKDNIEDLISSVDTEISNLISGISDPAYTFDINDLNSLKDNYDNIFDRIILMINSTGVLSQEDVNSYNQLVQDRKDSFGVLVELAIQSEDVSSLVSYLEGDGSWDNQQSFFDNTINSVLNRANEGYTSFVRYAVETTFDYQQASSQEIDSYSQLIYEKIESEAVNDITRQIDEFINSGTATSVLGVLANAAGNFVSSVADSNIPLISSAARSLQNTTAQLVSTGGNEAVPEGSSTGILKFISNILPEGAFRQTIGSIGDFLQTIYPSYQNGVTETRFGLAMERSWASEFLTNLNSIQVNIVRNSPLNPASGSLYGNMMLGAPLNYTSITDPGNRSMINTFVKDSNFLSLTPGLPKYNGGSFQQEVLNALGGESTGGSYLNQTETADEIKEYLLKNGLDSSFSDKDKRYYTFQAKYEEYFAYLETMLNTVWVKMGLGSDSDGSLNIYSFFNPENTANYDATLDEKYKSSIGFFVNPAGAVTEAVQNETFNPSIGNEVNDASEKFQRLNYLTGMGTGNVLQNARRRIGTTALQLAEVRDIATQAIGQSQGIGQAISSLVNFSNTQDMSALMQRFSVTNGMKVQYPQLWGDSSLMRSMSFTFNFVSPYGDPLSIFQYVYVPFLSLLTFAMPRQAAQNGLVSPFFVRADIPGWVTSDLAIISDLNWQRGGNDGTMWTKDKLPRAISGSFTVYDLYPYLAMTKRISFLSANPSYTVFLDNMAGLRALYNGSDEDPFNEYWEKMMSRVSGTAAAQGLWNRFNSNEQSENINFTRTTRESLSKSINKKAAPWLSKI